MAGKGDKQRPMNKKQYDSNWDEISKPTVSPTTEAKRLKNGKVRYSYTTKKEEIKNDDN